MEQIEFTEQEKKILGRSGDISVVRRYRHSSIALSLLFGLFFFAIGFSSGSWKLLAVFASLYVLITLAEKLAYAKALAGYKSVIVKLAKRNQELNQNERKS